MEKNVPFHSGCARFAQSAFARVTVFVCIIITLFSQGSYGQAQLVLDIMDREDYWSEEYKHLIDGNGTFYFVETNQLWRSDGTVSGTHKVMGFNYLESPLWVGETLYFVADDGHSGRELWKSDGTTGGTSLVKDIRPGPEGSAPVELTNVNGIIYFTANDGIRGHEVWKTNGTKAGTVLVKDILRVAGSSNPSGLTAMGGSLVFAANDGQHGHELWKTDGTESGTRLVKDAWLEGSSAPHSFVFVNGRVFFVARDAEGKELWITDGTSEGTYLVKAIRPGSKNAGIENMTAVNNTLFFTANDGVHGAELWKSNGTADGTALVKDMTPGPAGSHGEEPFQHLMVGFTNVNGNLFYMAYQNDRYFIWKSDGTTAGTIPLHIADGPGISNPNPQFTYINGSIYYFNKTYEANGDEYFLYRMNEDGSSPEIIQPLYIYDYYNPYDPQIAIVGDHLYFTGQTSGGTTLIKSDGTPEGTHDFIDVRDGTLDSNPDNFVVFNNMVYFDVMNWEYWFYDNYPQGGVWRTDGTSWGTHDVMEHLDVTTSAVADDALFVAGTLWNRTTVWRIDRQNNETQLAELDYGRKVASLVLAGETLFFATTTGELWRSDGTPEGTFMLMNVYAIRSITPVDDELMVQVIAHNGDEELWKSGGTAATTVKVRTIRNGWGTASRYYPTAVIEDILFFVANDGVHGNELWRSDGTAMGTYMAFDVNGNDRVESGNIEYDIADMTVFQDQLYFSALQIVDGIDTWSLRSYQDGEMSTGTHATDHPAVRLIPVAGHLFLVLEENGTSHALWSYYPGTELQWLSDLDGNYREGFDYEVFNGVLYYSTSDGAGLWRSDGSPCGTLPIDIGTTGAHEMALLGNTLLFASSEPEYGRELYSFDLSLDPGNPCEPGSTECTASGSITWEYWSGVEGNRVSDIPVNEPPAETSAITMFEGPSNIGIHYGTRIKGYVCPPLTGDYRFYIASNDHSELWLSTSDDPALKVRIADVTRATGSREWYKFANQQSVIISLVKGKRYYIEALHKQGVGTDHVAVAWTLPDGTFEGPIGGHHLSPFGMEDDPSIEASSARMSLSNLDVYPNPTISGDPSLTLSGYERMDESVETDIRITNMTGEVIFRDRIRCGGDCDAYLLHVNEKLVPGLYIVTLKAGGVQSSRRLVVK